MLTTALLDTVLIARRNLLRTRRVPDLLFFMTVQPILFVLLFGFVFGSGIQIPGIPYREYLLGGMLVQSVTFGAALTGIGLAHDLESGMFRRLATLPVAHPAVLAGRILADLTSLCLTIAVVAATGVLVGWRWHTSAIDLLAAVLLLLLYGASMCAVSAVIGAAVRNAEVAQGVGFLWMLPLVFVSNVFVDPARMAPSLRAFAQVNPVSCVGGAVRSLLGNASAGATYSVWPALAWSIVLLAVSLPLGSWLLRRRSW
jgi:ABC-2 type transport system permease protein